MGHEFEDLLPEWGEPVLENEALWDGLKARYHALLTEQFPEVDWLVLTVVESSIRVTDPAMLTKLIMLLREVCADVGRKLMIRSFVWTLEEFAGVKETIENLPEDVTVMTKYVPQDWHRGAYDDGMPFHDPLIGKVGNRDQIVELDIAGEYFRGDQIAHCFAEELHKRWKFWEEAGVDGLSVRIDRGWNAYRHHDCILYEVQESNLWCLGQWMTGAANDIDTPLKAWASERFGADVADELAKVARLCDPVVQEMLTVCNEPFGDTRRLQPALRSMQVPKEGPTNIYDKTEVVPCVDPFSRWLAMWRWDDSLRPRYELLASGDASMIKRKQEEYAEALVKADEAINILTSVKDKMDNGAYQVILFRIEENRHHLVLMCEAALAWLYCLSLPQTAEGDRPAVEAKIEEHLQAMLAEQAEHIHEAATVIWPAGRTRYMQRNVHIEVPQFCNEMRRYACMSKQATNSK